MIPVEFLEKYGGRQIKAAKHQTIFHQDDEALNYYQILEGQVKMANFSAGGQEFIQSLFEVGESFGEPALFGDFPYPASAIATEDCILMKLSKSHFFQLLQDHFEIHKKFNKRLSLRLRYKGMILKEISSYPPEHRISTLLNYLRDHDNEQKVFEVPLTRQQIADMTGLRVETVIRTIKKMEADRKVKLDKHKILMERPLVASLL